MNRKVRILFGLIIIGAVFAAAWWWQVSKKETAREAALVLYGNIDIREVDLAFNNSEHIDQLLVQEGDRVSKGQLLATLHQERLQAEVAVAKAKLAAQNAVVARLNAGTRPEEVRQAKANVAAARAKLTDAEITFDRTQKLTAKKALSRQALDDAQASLDTARANLKVAKETLALAEAGPRLEDIEEAKAVLNAEEAQLALAQEILKDTELYAPDDGVIRDRILEPGDMVTPQTPVLTLALTNPVWVRTYVPETRLGQLSLGMTAEVSTDSYPGKTYQGWVGFISPTAEFTPKNVETPDLRTRLVYQARVYICNPQNELRLGMPATVNIPLDQVKQQAGQAIPDCSGSSDD
ncbi:MAG TPA: efflux RND transporter periplasmic adaptor subunit [Gammaproteobacteria bacterium]|nr:efflux RND transporter periplasmic adaptor subunit [Gammaproteobacteria bacterium]